MHCRRQILYIVWSVEQNRDIFVQHSLWQSCTKTLPRLISKTNFSLHFVNQFYLSVFISAHPSLLHFPHPSHLHSFTLNSKLTFLVNPFCHRSLTIDTPDWLPRLMRSSFSVFTLLIGFFLRAMRSLEQIVAYCHDVRLSVCPSVCLSVCLCGTGVHSDHTVHFSAELSLWLDSSMFGAPWHQSIFT